MAWFCLEKILRNPQKTIRNHELISKFTEYVINKKVMFLHTNNEQSENTK